MSHFCLEVCAPQSWTEQNQNVEDGAELLEDAYSVTPPSDLEDSHSAFIEGMETSYDILERIPYGMVGGTEIDSLIDDAKEDFSRSVDLID